MLDKQFEFDDQIKNEIDQSLDNVKSDWNNIEKFIEKVAEDDEEIDHLLEEADSLSQTVEQISKEVLKMPEKKAKLQEVIKVSIHSCLLLPRAGVLNLLVLVYPQIKVVPLCVPPNQTCIAFAYAQLKNSTQISFI